MLSMIIILHVIFLSQGITLSVEEYDILMRTFQRDCQVLESFGIMDYSVLLGVHNVDEAIRVSLYTIHNLSYSMPGNLVIINPRPRRWSGGLL